MNQDDNNNIIPTDEINDYQSPVAVVSSSTSQN
jgi:hypothetical protein